MTLAASAAVPKTSMSVDDGGTPLLILATTLMTMPTPSSRMKAPLNAAAPAFHRSLRVMARRLTP